MSKKAVRVVRNQLVLSPARVNFQRTLPIPESGLHPRPPGLGRFSPAPGRGAGRHTEGPRLRPPQRRRMVEGKVASR